MALDCCPAATSSSARRRPRRGLGLAPRAIATGLAALIVPKCPLCLAVYLSALGASTGLAAAIASAARPAAIAILGLAAIAIGARIVRRSGHFA